MIIPTHRLVGKYVYLMASDENKKKISYRQFVWGNMKPDVLPEYKKLSHYYPANEGYVMDLLEKACNPNLEKKQFSGILGVLIHFLCDYTCIYHNNMTINEANSMRKHMQYEFILHLYTQTKIRKDKPQILQFKNLDDVKYHIYQVINRANLDGMVPDMKQDYKDMMQMSSSVVNFILQRRISSFA